MKSKEFTLIELLAVIVILAIIALIATPIILNIIYDTKESSKERSKELYLDAVANTIAAYNMKNPMVDLSNADGLIGKLEEIAEVWGLDIEQVVLPSAKQIMLADGKNENDYMSWPTLANEWLYNWPANNVVSYGYWTSSNAWAVDSVGFMNDNFSVNSGIGYFGVRPVITIKLN